VKESRRFIECSVKFCKKEYMLKIPVNGAEIQEVDGVEYLVARLDKTLVCSDYVDELRKGRPVVVPSSKRGHLTTQLKAGNISTRQKSMVAGQWIAFIPCEAREFKS